MEDLTKQQVILLALLLSFVTSIGTGIITVSLLDEAPDTVTQTINRVVEKTIENVLPTQTTIKETEKQTQVVVEKDDLITNSVDEASKSMVRVYTVLGEDKVFFSIGVVVRDDGIVALSALGFVPTYKYSIVFDNGDVFDAKVPEDISTTDNVAFLSIVKGEKEADKKFSIAKVGNTGSLKLGQSIINIGGDKSTSIQVGRIASLAKVKDVDGKESIEAIETDISSATQGSLIVDFSGTIIGFNSNTGEARLNKSFIVAGDLIPKAKVVPETPPTNNNP